MHAIKDIKQALAQDYYSLPKHWLQEWLLHVIDQPLNFLITNDSYVLSTAQLARFTAGIDAMRTGTPLAYLTHRVDFWSLPFYVNRHTLIPRPDTEILVETALYFCQKLHQQHHFCRQRPLRLLDLGTGSGCLAIAIKKTLDCQGIANQISACDKSLQALTVAKRNALDLQIDVDFTASDWFDGMQKKFDIIVSNPPYIDKNDPHLPALSAEPMSALVAKNHGLADLAHIIAQAPTHLTPNGWLLIEHGYRQAVNVRKYLAKAHFSAINTRQDYGGNPRLSYGCRC